MEQNDQSSPTTPRSTASKEQTPSVKGGSSGSSRAVSRAHRGGVFVKFLGRVTSASKTALAIVGFGTLASLALEYKIQGDRTAKSGDENQKVKGEPKKRVLVIPFHRMRVVEKRSTGSFLNRPFSSHLSVNDDEKMIEVEVKELVDLIHAAAADPECVAIQGTFGHGFRFQSGGHSHIEEIRNAIRIFNESHRIHPEPNVNHDKNASKLESGALKTSYAFSDSFAHPADSGNKEFYLASAFTHVNLQPRGELDLFGLSMSTPFFRSAMDKYGVKAHVFKHGLYKNAPNSLSETGYTKEHKENARSLLNSINDHMCMEIARSRLLPATFDESMWNAIRNYGTLTAQNAREIGLVDNLPRINPLSSLIKFNRCGEQEMAKLKEKWTEEVDFDEFNAKESISLLGYARLVAKRKKSEERKWKIHGIMEHLTKKSAATEFLLSRLGYQSPHFNVSEEDFTKTGKAMTTKEKIAVVYINGKIDHSVALKVSSSLQKIEEDKNVKCVILRVDSPGGSATSSETILEECKHLSKPLVCSMSNAAASGGYYVATNCDRIFALPNTFTGSIGVFGIKFDFTGLASQYGVKVQNISNGPLSSCNSLFQPLTKEMEINFRRNVDRIYDYFKEIVSLGRGMTMDEVEAIAQGRVWTGEQALQVGLVDNLGGLDRAIAYAKKTYTSGEAHVEVWPKPPSFASFLKAIADGNMNDALAYIHHLQGMLALCTMQENDIIRENNSSSIEQLLLPNNGVMPTILHGKLDRAGGMMLTANEGDAILLGLNELSGRNNHTLVRPPYSQ